MSSILSEDAEERRTKRADDSVRDPAVRILRAAMEDGDGERSGPSRENRLVRTFLLVDLGAAMRYLRGRRGGSEAAEALTELAPEVELEAESDEGGQGRGVLQRLFLLGVVVGLGYVLSRRSESMGQVVSQATDRARSVADQAEMRSGEMAGQTEAAAGEAADRIEETGGAVTDEAADRVREGGEMAADHVQESGEMAADEIEEAADATEEAEEKAEDTGSESGEDEESEE
ncbi:hypothetical protein [Halorussus salinisoli]|uniref:hypothetical protein n=1 Tax=Halorussus salinisoli TaxID=2558242 RepID=UPI0010C1FC26|nr:hypothetical protein [Halorussus salinisoli]